ncbi:hypothetical protein ACRAWF_45820 [Streptomyces sp. L7]
MSSSAPTEHIDDVRDAILEAGEAFGVRQIGARAYASVATEVRLDRQHRAPPCTPARA